jgi:hypothetical protein
MEVHHRLAKMENDQATDTVRKLSVVICPLPHYLTGNWVLAYTSDMGQCIALGILIFRIVCQLKPSFTM